MVRAIHKQLGFEMELWRMEGVLEHRADTYLFAIEYLDSPSFPGLPSVYRAHYRQVGILEANLPVFNDCGLPDGSAFVTMHANPSGVLTYFWRGCDATYMLEVAFASLPAALALRLSWT